MFNYYHQFYFPASGVEPYETEIIETIDGTENTTTTVITPDPIITIPDNKILVGANGELEDIIITSITIHALPKTGFQLDDAVMYMNNTGKFEWNQNCNIKFLKILKTISNIYHIVIDITYIKDGVPIDE